MQMRWRDWIGFVRVCARIVCDTSLTCPLAYTHDGQCVNRACDKSSHCLECPKGLCNGCTSWIQRKMRGRACLCVCMLQHARVCLNSHLCRYRNTFFYLPSITRASDVGGVDVPRTLENSQAICKF